MLEKYHENFKPDKFVAEYMAENKVTRAEALRELRQKIPKENYYQNKIKRKIKERYPDSFVRKIAQGAFSESGIPDIMAIVEGHYFGFEVKRPIVGIPSDLQLRTISQISLAGGTAALISWPEEALIMIEGYLNSSIAKIKKQRMEDRGNDVI